MSNRLTFSLASLIVLFVAGIALILPSTAEAGPLVLADVADQTYTQAVEIAELTLPAATGATAGATVTYALASLPDGLTFDAATRKISGTPNGAQGRKLYTYTAKSDSNDDTDVSIEISITVNANQSPTFDPASEDVTFKIGKTVDHQLPEASDPEEQTITYALKTGNDTLPAGLTYIPATRKISGIPSADGTATYPIVVIVEATDPASNLTPKTTAAEYTINITVVESTPPVFAATDDVVIMATEGEAIVNKRLPIATDADGDKVSYNVAALNSALPLSLQVTDFFGDGSTWVLGGTPGAGTAQAETEYMWTATDGDPDSDDASVTIKITIEGPAVAVAPGAPTAVTAAVDQAANEITISWTAPAETGGADITAYTVTKSYMMADGTAATKVIDAGTATSITIPTAGEPALPQGVDFTFTVTATNSAGEGPASAASAPVMINVDQVDPDIVQPTNVMAEAQTDGSIMVTWAWAGADATETAALDGFTVMWNESIMMVAADQTSYTIPAHMLTAGSETTVRVLARATAGSGFATPAAPSAMSNPVTPVDPAVLGFDPDSIDDMTFTAGTAIGTTAMPYVQLPRAYGGTGVYTYSLLKGIGKVDVTDTGDNGLSVDRTNLRLMGTPTAEAASTLYTWRVTDAQAHGDIEDSVELEFNITVDASPITNVAPVVTITTAAPTTAQTESFAIAYTVTDADAGDTYTVSATSDAPTGYTLDASTAGMVTVMQAKGSNAANVTVTVTATDAAGATGSDSISVIFAERVADPALVAPGAPILSAVAGDKQVTLIWTTPTGDIASYEYSMNDRRVWVPVPNSTAATTSHTVTTHADGTTALTNGQTYTFVVRAINAEHEGPASNEIAATPVAAPPVRDTTPPTVTVGAAPHPINCESGSTLSFGFSEALAAGEAVAATELTVSAGWKAVADGGAIKLVPMGDGTEIGVTTVSVSVNAGAVKDAAGNGNAASAAKVFTVGPVLEIPAGGFIVVIRPEHINTTHLRDPLYIGSTGVRAPMVDIQPWECMPDLTIFFGLDVPAIGGGAIVIKEADGPLGHDPGGSLADIAKGSVGLSEIMWASDEGAAHGGVPPFGRSNIDQTREQWIELHNRNNTAVKVTLFARPTSSALTVENDELDRVSNYNINRVWNAPGQSGNSELGIDFVSMQRGKHDNKGLAPTTAAGYAHGDWNGTYSNGWSASTISYLTRRAGLGNTGQIAAENLLYDFLGTPGRNNKPGVSTPILRTNVPMNSIVFNEISNRRDQTLEWIELKNVSDAEVNLKKYQISLATAKGTDVAFYTFPDNDNIKLAAGELLLLLDTSPRDNDAHPIAVGQDRDTGNDQALGLGQNQDPKAHLVKYKVANFREGGLPDDGNFVLYLRNRNDRLKSREGIIDVIGWSDKLADSANHTQVWPLQVFGAPDARNKIAVETVHYRQHRIDPDESSHSDDKDEHQALRDAGYTGIGYKRHAQRIAVHGGTPGYEEIRKNENPQLAQGNLTISEIMYDQGDGQYPQWIEIYNSSETEAVNLHAGDHGWRLNIENFDDGEISVNRLSGTLNFRNSDVQTILPQQTVIVASTRARNSGSAFFDTRVVFPATRVFSVWDDARGALDMKRSTDPILSEEGFYIELIDGKNNFVDGVGNLVRSPNRRVAAEKAWELSEVTGEMMEDIVRSSILRRYREYEGGKLVGSYTDIEVEDMGVEAAGWIAAHKTDFLDVRQTWFGHPEDYGSPGITGGRVLPVELSKFRPQRLDDGSIRIVWITESELNNAGFNILRSEKSDGEFKQINTKLIAGQGTTSERTVYTHTDTSAKPNVVYYYQIQDVSLDGKVQTLQMSRLKGHISAAGKATTTWGELKALQ